MDTEANVTLTAMEAPSVLQHLDLVEALPVTDESAATSRDLPVASDVDRTMEERRRLTTQQDVKMPGTVTLVLVVALVALRHS